MQVDEEAMYSSGTIYMQWKEVMYSMRNNLNASG